MNPKAESKIRQGVTLEVIGNCGNSAAPLKGELFAKAEKIADDYGINLYWSSLDEYHNVLENQGVSLNVASLVGHGTIRASIMSFENRAPTRTELEEMKNLLDSSMKSGAFGLSTGLIYPPGSYARTDELVDLCKVASKNEGFYSSHVRSQNSAMFEAVKEAIKIGEKADLPVNISHEIPAPPIWGRVNELLQISEEARRRGLDISCDILVYKRGQTGLKALMPGWVNEGGDDKLVERIKDPRIRERIIIETMEKGSEAGGSAKRALIQLGKWNRIWLADCFVNKELCGKSFAEIADIRGLIDPFDVVFDLLIEEDAKGSIMGEDKLQEDIDYALNHPLSMVGSDGSALAPYGVLGRGKSNPRSYGTFPKVFREYVRERKIILLEEAVRKMTSFPAQRLGLFDRGILKRNSWADIVIFDKMKIMDRASYADPYRYPDGILYVLVNGEIVVEKGEHKGSLPGHILKHEKGFTRNTK